MPTATMHRDTRARQRRNAPVGLRAATILAIAALAITATACENFNPFVPLRATCVSWLSLHPVDTTRSSTLAVAHQDSVCTPKH